MLVVTQRPRARPHPIALLAVAGLAVSLLVHVASLAGIAPQESMRGVWGLHAGVFVVFFPFVSAVRRWLNGHPIRWRALLLHFPAWVRIAVPALLLYVSANFFLAVRHLPAKGETHAEYVGRVGSTVAAAKVVYEVRAFSGHWLFLYLLPALFFLYMPPEARQAEEQAVDENGNRRQAAV